jgi:hypothetical protein
MCMTANNLTSWKVKPSLFFQHDTRRQRRESGAKTGSKPTISMSANIVKPLRPNSAIFYLTENQIESVLAYRRDGREPTISLKARCLKSRWPTHSIPALQTASLYVASSLAGQ